FDKNFTQNGRNFPQNREIGWTYTGVNTSIEGAGGQSCINYITTKRRFFESACVCITFLYTLYWSYLKFSVGNPRHSNEQTKLRQILLVLHTFVFGIEIGFKLATSTLIWILNPCHIITILQVIRFELLHLFALFILFLRTRSFIMKNLLKIVPASIKWIIVSVHCFVYFHYRVFRFLGTSPCLLIFSASYLSNEVE
ncbi:unnamed protein product, partial [Schistosoma mattheei]